MTDQMQKCQTLLKELRSITPSVRDPRGAKRFQILHELGTAKGSLNIPLDDTVRSLLERHIKVCCTWIVDRLKTAEDLRLTACLGGIREDLKIIQGTVRVFDLEAMGPVNTTKQYADKALRLYRQRVNRFVSASLKSAMQFSKNGDDRKALEHIKEIVWVHPTPRDLVETIRSAFDQTDIQILRRSLAPFLTTISPEKEAILEVNMAPLQTSAPTPEDDLKGVALFLAFSPLTVDDMALAALGKYDICDRKERELPQIVCLGATTNGMPKYRAGNCFLTMNGAVLSLSLRHEQGEDGIEFNRAEGTVQFGICGQAPVKGSLSQVPVKRRQALTLLFTTLGEAGEGIFPSATLEALGRKPTPQRLGRGRRPRQKLAFPSQTL